MQQHEVESALHALVAPHEASWRDSVHQTLKHHADRQLTAFNAYWSTVTPGEKIPASWDRPMAAARQQPPGAGYVRHPQNVGGALSLHPLHGSKVHAAQNGTATLDHAAVKRDADETFDDMKAQFVARGAAKIQHIAGARTVATVSGALQMRGALEGNIHAHIDDHNHFDIDAATQHNYRYGDAAANRQFTHYVQYPFRVSSAHVNGSRIAGASADDLAVRWGGVPAAQAERNRVTASKGDLTAWKAKGSELEKTADSWRAIHDTVKPHARDTELASVARDQTHPKHAKMQSKSDADFKRHGDAHPWLRDSGSLSPTTLADQHPTPAPLDDKHPAHKHLARVGLSAWPSTEDAKTSLDSSRAALADHKLRRP